MGVALLAAVPLLAAAYYLAFELAATGGITGLPLDDSWIHLVFARSLAHGEGLAFNPGELVPASTAPLWTALISLLHLLPFEPRLPIKLLGTLLAALGVVEAARLARALGLPRALAALAAAAVATTDWLAWSALSGMEIPLFVLLSLTGMRLHAEECARRRSGRLSLLLLALAALARPEGLLLLLLALGERLVTGPAAGARARRALVDVALIGAVLAPVALFNLAIAGSPLPTTFAAKTSGLPRLLPDLHALYLAFGLLFRSQPVLSLLAAGGALALATRRLADRRTALLPALWLFALPCALALLRAPGGAVLGNFGRYLFPLFPVLAVVGCAALARPLAELERRDGRGQARLVGLLVLVAVLAPALSTLVRGGGRYAQSVANVEASDVRLARWLAPRLAPEALLAVADVGAIRYLLPNRVLDLGALVTPELEAELRREAAGGAVDRGEALSRFLERRGADFVVAYPRFIPSLESDPARFAPLVRVAIPDNITMAGDELVLYRTGWCRHPLRAPEPSDAEPHPTRRSPP